MGNMLIGLGLSSATGFKPFIPLLIISVASKMGMLELVNYTTWMDSYITITILAILSIIDLIGTSIPIVGQILNTLSFPLSLICGCFAITAVMGQTLSSSLILKSLIGIIVGGGSSAIVKTFSYLKDLAIDSITLGVSTTVNSIFNFVMAILASIIAIIAPIIMLVLLAIFLIVGYKMIQKIKRKKAEKDLVLEAE